MQLIGMLDSPYVRRVAISLKFLQIPFEHRAISVFGGYAKFAESNPVVKAPTLVTDHGVVLMDSSVILQYLETRSPRRLGPSVSGLGTYERELRRIGLALVACEKTVQLVYETRLRPVEKQHGPWIDRVTKQLIAAYDELEKEIERSQREESAEITQAFITTAVAWRFTKHALPELLREKSYARLSQQSDAAEERWEFSSTPLE